MREISLKYGALLSIVLASQTALTLSCGAMEGEQLKEEQVIPKKFSLNSIINELLTGRPAELLKKEFPYSATTPDLDKFRMVKNLSTLTTLMRNKMNEDPTLKENNFLIISDVDGTLTPDPKPRGNGRMDVKASAKSDEVWLLKQLRDEGVNIILSSAWDNFERTKKTIEDIGLAEFLEDNQPERNMKLIKKIGLVASVSMDPKSRYFRNKAYAPLQVLSKEKRDKIRHIIFCDDSAENMLTFRADMRVLFNNGNYPNLESVQYFLIDNSDLNWKDDSPGPRSQKVVENQEETLTSKVPSLDLALNSSRERLAIATFNASKSMVPMSEVSTIKRILESRKSDAELYNALKDSPLFQKTGKVRLGIEPPQFRQGKLISKEELRDQLKLGEEEGKDFSYEDMILMADSFNVPVLRNEKGELIPINEDEPYLKSLISNEIFREKGLIFKNAYEKTQKAK